ncbi:ABC transporter ATP-binding protein [Pseudohoeflea sp. DP4N28-3]|uniref:ABC transporter ATP-binding protein n=1 Tax=Pseudohoeflea coraliihabitans TaxID=2860393 RepID=A0ABS6WSS3_9HYPH|nr:ABC transporter ATP-binding protein [Pseudohoeflea sp. DP4N28-3]
MLEVRDLSKKFGGLEVSRGVSLDVAPGERRVLLGPNGAGKTTLFNLIAGTLKPDCGTIRLDGSDITGMTVNQRARRGLARSFQKNNLFEGLSVRDNLALAVATGEGRTGSLLACAHDSAATLTQLAEIAAQVGLSAHLDWPVAHCSYGVRRQLEIGLALATRPRLLLLDEPTSGIGPEGVAAFNALIASLPRHLAMIIIEHDLDLAFSIADRISVLSEGVVVFEGTPETTRHSRQVRELYLGAFDD